MTGITSLCDCVWGRKGAEWPKALPCSLPRAAHPSPPARMAIIHSRTFLGTQVPKQFVNDVPDSEQDCISLPPQPHPREHGGMPLKPSTAQIRVARLAIRGKTNREIAAELSLQLQTVKNELSAAMRRLGVRNRVELANRFREPARNDGNKLRWS